MDFEKWKRIKTILQEAIELPADARAEFLDGAGLSSDERAEIAALLEVEEASGDFLSVTAGRLAGEILESGEPDAAVGQRIGVYEITGELGIGGMGAVYRAERRDGKFEQQVAVKLLKREFNVDRIRRGFRREREIQAALEHPLIARLLDAGTTDDGIPFLAMEYVEGVGVDEFCETARLSETERLKLFNKICDAVAHAHRNLVIHRDLKPSNILVSKDGVPKLLDFGIATFLDVAADGDLPGEANPPTIFGALTPAYASPEQRSGGRVSTATDIYSLGVVLHKMLSGKLPPNGRAVQSVTGDLRNIVEKALDDDPARRYGTVEQFSADIWRFIDGLPVSARAATLRYRVVRFYQRNRLAVSAALLIAASVVGGGAVAVWQAREARIQAAIALEARNEAELETQKARAEQLKSEKISKFMTKIISYGNPAWYAWGAKFGGNARVIDVLEDLSGQIDTEFAGQADVQAELHHEFAEVFLWVAKDGDAAFRKRIVEKRVFHSKRALELRREFYGNWHELVAKDLFYAYGVIAKDVDEEAALLDEAIRMMRGTNPENLNLPYMYEAYTTPLLYPEFAGAVRNSYLKAVRPATDENEYQISERYLRESLPIYRRYYNEDNGAILAAECKLAYSLIMQKKWDDFDAHYAECRKSTGLGSKSPANTPRELVENALALSDRQSRR